MVDAQGSTSARTRLYQIGITNHFEEITKILNIYGFVGGKWQQFKKGVNYNAFLVARK